MRVQKVCPRRKNNKFEERQTESERESAISGATLPASEPHPAQDKSTKQKASEKKSTVRHEKCAQKGRNQV